MRNDDRMERFTTDKMSDAAERLRALEAELASLPAKEQAAIAAADTAALVQLPALRQVLTHQINLAAAELATIEQAALDVEVSRINAALMETTSKASEYDYAAAVYQQLTNDWRGREEHLHSRLLRLLEQRSAAGGR